ncbi:DUF1688-domain-containing protein [Aureobasidium pullulans]|uniref:DUF1688-domain-containing protein n=1 Tax=Aureobasidium pullulans TaxID=5580 RepID=A0A4V4JYE2_AURPU|nr:DUF1688-domain-containing protein [Aureobasidium pullulans]
MSTAADRDYLLTLEAVREQAGHVYEAAVAGKLENFEFHASRLDATTDYVVSLILRDCKPEDFDKILPHGRWQHFNAGGVSRLEPLIEDWRSAGVDDIEISRRVVDVIVVSVLLDAGAGDHWKFTENGATVGCSEGLAIASLSAFKAGVFGESCVDARTLANLGSEKLAAAMQSTPQNPLLGMDSRTTLLQRLGSSLLSNPNFQLGPRCRPGHLVDYVLANGSVGDTLDFKVLWILLQGLLIPTWPEGRTTIAGVAIGDAWPLDVLTTTGNGKVLPIQPFHKLTQWLAYSLTSAVQRLLKKDWINLDILTGLPEYRNGGLFVDMGVLVLKPKILVEGLKASGKSLPQYDATGDVIVEWRAMTVVLLDVVADMVNEKLTQKLGKDTRPLTLAQILEAGTWKAGRELAARYRAYDNACSPILMFSDGTLF